MKKRKTKEKIKAMGASPSQHNIIPFFSQTPLPPSLSPLLSPWLPSPPPPCWHGPSEPQSVPATQLPSTSHQSLKAFHMASSHSPPFPSLSPLVPLLCTQPPMMRLPPSNWRDGSVQPRPNLITLSTSPETLNFRPSTLTPRTSTLAPGPHTLDCRPYALGLKF